MFSEGSVQSCLLYIYPFSTFLFENWYIIKKYRTFVK